MAHPEHSRSIETFHPHRFWIGPGTRLLCCAFLASALAAASAQVPEETAPPAETQSHRPSEAAPTDTSTAPPPPSLDPSPTKHNLRQAEDAYLAGAKKLQHNDLTGALLDFAKALTLDPQNREYRLATSIVREHRLNELVQQAAKARLTGNPARAETLLAEARALDPTNPLVLEHTQPALQNPRPPQPGATQPPLTNRARLLGAGEVRAPWVLPPPVLAGALQLTPAEGVQSFQVRGDSEQVLRQVASAYGIHVIFDDSVQHKNLRFELDNEPYDRTMAILMKMAGVFGVSLDPTNILIARDSVENRQRLERQLEQTIYLPGKTPEQINDLANVLRNVFEVKQAIVQATIQSIVIRAPEDIFPPLDRTLEDLLDSSGEVMLEVKLYEVDTTHTRNIGATIPQQFTTFNVDAAATNIVNANQSLVQEAIAQGYITSSTSNLQIALALIQLGLVQSSLLTNLVGVFGGGIFQTGINGSTSASFSLAFNASDIRTLDDVEMRVDDRVAATFRAGTRYPVTTSTYTTGLSTAASSLSNATINGVSVASLLAQYAGGTSTTIPQVSYEDLGVTLKATPTIQKTGRINLLLDMKIEALAGGSNDGIPILGSRQFTSDITVANGESAMLVSYITRNETAAVTGIPGLSELPGFQAPLDQNAEKDTGQLIVMVTPRVVRRRSDMVAGPRLLIRPQEAAPAPN